jgi:aldose 1-epimerase
MQFQIKQSTINHVTLIQLLDIEFGVTIDILTRGALINSWLIRQGDKSQQFIMGNPLNAAKEFESQGFRSAKMSPYVCRLFKGQYAHLNTTYIMDRFYMGEHAIHGIMYDADFKIQATEANEHQATVILVHHYLGSDQGYPFPFTMHVKWILEKNNKISVQTTVINDAAISIPIVDGWHPYFTLGESIDHCTLQFSSKGKMEYDKDLLPTGNIIEDARFSNGLKIGSLQLDDGYALDTENSSCTLQNEQFILKINPSSLYPYLQLYIPPDRNSIAIENLSGAPNAFNNKMGLQLVKPQDNIVFETSYQVVVK